MKMIAKNLAYFLFVGLIGFSSCGDSDETVPAPTLTFKLGNATSGSFNANETASFTMDLAADNDFTSLKGTLVYTKNDNSTATLTIKDANNSNKEMDYTKNSDIKGYAGTKVVKVVLPSDAQRGTEWTITVSAATSGGTTTATFKGKVVNSWSAKLLGAQSNAAGSFFNSSTGNVLSGSQANTAPAGVDITYAAIGTPIASPTILSYKFRGDASTGLTAAIPAAAEETFFIETTLTPTQFLDETLSWTTLLSGLNFTSQKVIITEGNVYAFKNKNGKMGLIHIASVVQGLAGSATINVKAEN
jgi:hypothetical protein